MNKKHHFRSKPEPRTGEPQHAGAASTEAVAAAVQPQGAYALLADYEQRSLAHDPGVPEQIEAPGLWRAIGFRVGDHHFVSGIDEISEILMSPPPVTSIPATRAWLLGVANVRGNLIALVDLKQFLFEQRTHVTGRARVLVVKQGGGNVGLLVDELIGQRTLTDADRAKAEGEADPSLARFVTENVTSGAVRLGRFSMVELTHAPEFQHAAL
ncbi:MAG: chemotaxis protein CheW [Rhodanobacteraceae bacterium]